MNIFKKFKVTFNLKNPKTKGAKKKDATEVRCLNYRIISEFTQERVFNTNPRHFNDHPFTPTQSKKLPLRSVSEIDLRKIGSEDGETESGGELRNAIWPSTFELTYRQDSATNTNDNTGNKQRNEEGPSNNELKETPKPPRGILKDTSSKTKSDYEPRPLRTRPTEEEPTYEPFERIDTDLENPEEVYYFDQVEDGSNEDYEVHLAVHDETNMYEEPVKCPKMRGTPEIRVNGMSVEYDEAKSNKRPEGTHVRLNTFGNTQKLNYPGVYSDTAASIFFDDEDYEDTPSSNNIVFHDNISEMSA